MQPAWAPQSDLLSRLWPSNAIPCLHQSWRSRMRRSFALVTAIAACLVAIPSAHAQPYPQKPVRIVVPYSAGGPVDVLTRGLAQRLSELWGQPVIVDNKPGGNEIVAAQSVASAAPDGYTLMMASDATLTLNQF